jgi:hypothetical protein
MAYSARLYKVKDTYPAFLMNIVLIIRIYLFSSGSTFFQFFSKSTQCSPKVNPCGAIFGSILPVNIAYYSSLPKTLKLTPPELMKNAG